MEQTAEILKHPHYLELDGLLKNLVYVIQKEMENGPLGNFEHFSEEEFIKFKKIYQDRIKQISDLNEQLIDTNVKVVFGGIFSSGKSTIINKLLGEKVLPTSIVQDTGVSCYVKRGEEKVAEIWSNKKELTNSIFDFTRTQLEELISLSDDHKRADLGNIDHLVLNLDKSAIPENVLWIDSPGIGDDFSGEKETQSEDRATLVAGKADILIWVSRSDKPLLEKEEAFLKAHIEGASPSAVIFVYNVWVQDGYTAEEWNAVFNDDFFENEIKIRRFFEPYQKMLYLNQIHKFSPPVKGLPDNDSYFNHFTKELNKLTTADRDWVRTYRMKKIHRRVDLLGFFYEGQLSDISIEIENKLTEVQNKAKEANDKVNEAIKSTLGALMNQLTTDKTSRLKDFSYFAATDESLNRELACDTRNIPGAITELNNTIVEIIQSTLFPHKTEEWLRENPQFRKKKLYKVIEFPKISATIIKSRDTIIDGDAILENIGKWGKALWDGSNPNYNDTDKLDYATSEINTKNSIESAYQKYISELTTLRKTKSDLKRESELNILVDSLMSGFYLITKELAMQAEYFKQVSAKADLFSKFPT